MRREIKDLRRKIEDRCREIHFPWAVADKLKTYPEYAVKKDGISGVCLINCKSYEWVEVGIPVRREHFSVIPAKIKLLMSRYYVSGHKTEINAHLSVPYFSDADETPHKLETLLERMR